MPPSTHRATAALSLPIALAVPALAAQANTPELETVEVRARQLQNDLLKQQALTPGGVSLIDSEALYQRNVTNLAEMLRYAPGIWSESSTGGDGIYLSSRGSNLDATNYDMNGIKLLQDGLPVTTADGNNHNRLLDPLSSRYATVARGANALTYGASTLGGAINFESPTARNSAPLQVYLNGGSDGLFNARASAGGISDTNGMDGLITLEHKEYDGYRDHSAEDRKGLYANSGWQFAENAKTRLYLTYLNHDRELPGTLNEQQIGENPDQATDDALSGHFQVNVETWRVASKTDWSPDENSDFSIGLSYEEQSLYHPIVDVRVDVGGPELVQVFSLLIDTEQTNIGGNLRYNLRKGDHDILFGLNYGETDVTGGNYSHNRAVKTRLDTRVENSASSLELFAMDRWQLSADWTLVYGLQTVWAEREVWNQDVASGAVRAPSGDYDSINPRAGVIYQLNDSVDLFANLSRTYEAPTNYELEDELSASNSTLDAMSGVVLELGSRGQQSIGRASQWRWDLALYYGQIDDEILSKDDLDAPGTSLTANFDSTVHAGVEALVGASFALDRDGVHRLAPTLSLTVNEFEFDGDDTYGDNQLPAAPGYALRGELLYRHTSGFYAGPTFDVIDDRYADFSNSHSVDGYELLGFRTGYDRARWQAFVEFRNVLDEEYVSTFSVRDSASALDNILYPGAPRSIFAGFRFTL